ncbi:MAG: IS630 family transposase [Geminicoccaceae bacterium]
MAWKSGQSHSADLRSRVLAAVDAGVPARAAAERFRVSVSYIYKALSRRNETGESEARPQRNHQELKLAAHHEAIAAAVARQPDATLDELRAWLLATHGVGASLGLMHKTLARLGLTPEKKSLRAEEQGRPELAAQRALWRAGQDQLNPQRLVFVDETGAATNMARRYGRGPRGRRVDGPVPHGHWKSTTFVGGLTTRGLVAPYVTDGAMNGTIFKAWVEQMLAPTLRPGDIVIMDNLPAHKVAGIQKAITDRGAELRYLPPYSPDLNPIEQAFAKLKALLRKAAERTVQGLWNLIGQLLELFPPAECANYLVNSGYPRSA